MPSSLAALVPGAAISTRPMLFAYQNAPSAAASANTRAQRSRRPPMAIVALLDTFCARSPVRALPVMIDVDHPREVGRGEPHLQRRGGFDGAGRQRIVGNPGGDRGEEIAAVKRCGQGRRPPGDPPCSRVTRARRGDREQTVVRADVPLAVGLHDRGFAFAANAGIDDREEDGARWEPGLQGGKQVRARVDAEARDRVQQIEHRRRGGEPLDQRSLHLAHVEVVGAEVGEENDHDRRLGGGARPMLLPARPCARVERAGAPARICAVTVGCALVRLVETEP